MKLAILQENLSQALGTVGRAVAARSTLPVLSNVLLETDGARLKLSANNFEMGINCWVGAKVEEAGAITVPARLLADFVNSLPPERIDMELDEETLSVTLVCSRYEATIKGILAEEFPAVPSEDEADDFITLPGDELQQMIKQVVFAAATDESRPVFGGVFVKFGGSTVTMAAADGFRLSVRNGVDADVSPGQVIIPARSLAELARLIDDDEPVRMALRPSIVIFAGDGWELVSGVIDGAFPDYNQIIPSGYTTRCIIDTAQFIKTVRIGNLFARDSANILKLTIFPPDAPATIGAIKFFATSAEMGDQTAELDATITGEGLTVALDAKFLEQALGVMPRQVALEASGAIQPVVLRPVGNDDFLHVIMPMNIQR